MSKDKKEQTNDTIKSALGSLLKNFESDHYNFIKDNPIKVSTGSLLLDQEISLTEGVHRFVGFSGSGKSSEALLVMKNFLESDSNRRGILIKAEGRLSENIRNRSGVKFVSSSEEWNFGTCFVFETNIMEVMCSTLDVLVKTAYERGEKLCIVIDSIDALRLKSDEGKDLGSEKIAGPQLLMKRFLTRMVLPIQKYGCICICISQVSTSIKIDPYSKEPPRLTSGGGGYGIIHFANYILEFEPRFNGDDIYEDPSKKYDVNKNKIIGHWATVTIKKSDKENEHVKIKYPIKHDRIGGNSIWIEYEIVDSLIKWELVKQKGAWLTFQNEIVEELKTANLELVPQHQGLDNLRIYFEQNPIITKFLFDKLRKTLSK